MSFGEEKANWYIFWSFQTQLPRQSKIGFPIPTAIAADLVGKQMRVGIERSHRRPVVRCIAPSRRKKRWAKSMPEGVSKRVSPAPTSPLS